MRNKELLLATLEVAVPLWIERLRDKPDKYIQQRAEECGQHIAEKGDVLQFGGKKGQAAEAFNRTAEGLACLSFCPGGVKFFDLHYETRDRNVQAPKNLGGGKLKLKMKEGRLVRA